MDKNGMIGNIVFNKTNSINVNTLIPLFKQEHQVYFSNFYGVADVDKCEIAELADTILVRKQENSFYRLYVCSSNFEELKRALNELLGDTYLLNIPTKTTIDDWLRLFEGTGFHFLAKYDRYYNKHIEYRESEIGVLATSHDIDAVYELIYNGIFSKYTDYLPSKIELSNMIRNDQVIINKVANRVLGVIIYTIEGRKCYLNLWIDHSGDGLYLLFDVYNIMVKKGLTYAYFWANSLNKKVIKIHTLTGAKPDGISDYSFIKQNTL